MIQGYDPLAETEITVKRPSLLLAAIAAALALSGSATAAGNPFGVTVVRFTLGTTPAQMRSTVTAAGAVIVADLSAIDALAVVPRSDGFAARVDRNAAVTAAFPDRVIGAGKGLGDQGGGGGPAPDVEDGSGGSFPDPWHNLSSFLGVTNPEGILQWDDNRMNVPAAWRTTTGDHNVVVAVLDTGVLAQHRELRNVLDPTLGGNFIPCADLIALYGLGYIDRSGLRDCRNGDFEGHGTWVASRIAGDANGFASNGVAPGVRIASYKVLAAGFGGLASWIASGLVGACSSPDVAIVNMSIEGYLDPSNSFDAQDYLLLADAVSYCRAQGVAVFAAGGNQHVRVDRVNLRVGGRRLEGAGRVTLGSEGIATVSPGSDSVAAYDLRGLLEVPAGIPGVTMISSTANAIGAAPADVPLGWQAHVGARDQLAYYSNYGARVDLAAPGGARRYEIPGYDGGAGDILYGGWGSFGALAPKGLICTDPFTSSLFNAACFRLAGQGFGWLQGTSMASPNAAGVAALVLSARPALRGHPDALVARLQRTARRSLVNYMGANDPSNFAPSLDGTPCQTGYCHVNQSRPIDFSDAYGAGLVDAGAAVTR
ncbi:MAG: S8 family serine peptidase [Gaiellaceae bacterium]